VSDIQPGPYTGQLAAQHGSEYQPLTITVCGRPAPQGSKRHAGNGVMVESSKAVKPWREDVKQAGLEATGWGERPCLDGPLRVSMVFTFGRPASHYGTGRTAGRLKPSAPLAPHVYPDLSKLARATEDALTDARVWRDDSRVVEYTRLAKVYIGPGTIATPGAVITIEQL